MSLTKLVHEGLKSSPKVVSYADSGTFFIFLKTLPHTLWEVEIIFENLKNNGRPILGPW